MTVQKDGVPLHGWAKKRGDVSETFPFENCNNISQPNATQGLQHKVVVRLKATLQYSLCKVLFKY